MTGQVDPVIVECLVTRSVKMKCKDGHLRQEHPSVTARAAGYDGYTLITNTSETSHPIISKFLIHLSSIILILPFKNSRFLINLILNRYENIQASNSPVQNLYTYFMTRIYIIKCRLSIPKRQRYLLSNISVVYIFHYM